MSPAEPAVASPCIQVCQLDRARVCIGCGRTLDEIAEWSAASDARKRAIREAAAARQDERRRDGSAAQAPASGSGSP